MWQICMKKITLITNLFRKYGSRFLRKCEYSHAALFVCYDCTGTTGINTLVSSDDMISILKCFDDDS